MTSLVDGSELNPSQDLSEAEESYLARLTLSPRGSCIQGLDHTGLKTLSPMPRALGQSEGSPSPEPASGSTGASVGTALWFSTACKTVPLLSLTALVPWKIPQRASQSSQSQRG